MRIHGGDSILNKSVQKAFGDMAITEFTSFNAEALEDIKASKVWFDAKGREMIASLKQPVENDAKGVVM